MADLAFPMRLAAVLPRSLLIIEDDKGLQSQMRWAMADGYTVHIAGNAVDALLAMSRFKPPIVVLDLGLPPDTTGVTEGLSVLEKIIEDYPATKTIVTSGNADRTNALKAISMGAYDYFSKPFDIEELKLILDRAWHLHMLEKDHQFLCQPEGLPVGEIVANSTVMKNLYGLVQKVAATDISILIVGESGTGKELIARAIHGHSPRARCPLVAVNCAAIPEALLESELFGHERGAFTGATRKISGKVEQAEGGTLFLDEIGDMPLYLQGKLLRFLQSHMFHRLGGSVNLKVDLRIIAATHQDLQGMVTQGMFREDLLFRLNEMTIEIPPLRERDGDAVLIAHELLQRFAISLKKGPLTFSPAALFAIANYRWPGNVRELENRIKRAVILCEGQVVDTGDFDIGNPNKRSGGLRAVRQRAETRAIQRALNATSNDLGKTAKVLEISRATLHGLLKTYGITISPR